MQFYTNLFQINKYDLKLGCSPHYLIGCGGEPQPIRILLIMSSLHVTHMLHVMHILHTTHIFHIMHVLHIIQILHVTHILHIMYVRGCVK